jgi:epoxyqueuosine reductase
LGFEVAAITSVQPLDRDLQALVEWCDAGFAAGMAYMTRRPELNGSPGLLVQSARSIITLAVNYYAPASDEGHRGRFGRVARYAWGRDYHDVVKPRLSRLAEQIEEAAGRPVKYRCFVDAVPLLERAAAARAGLGFFGKNTNLLQPARGSWFFLSEIFVDLELPEEGKRAQVSCGTCQRCLVACPTNAFAQPYKLDSRLCISYLTIENKGVIPRRLRQAMGEWVFGCDVCQDVCPFNRFSSETDWEELRPGHGPGQWLDLSSLLSISSDAEFRDRFAGTALARPKRRGLLRNAAVVAANIRSEKAVPALINRIQEDSEPLIRGHAIWALERIDSSRARVLAGAALKSDPDPFVREEAALVMNAANEA